MILYIYLLFYKFNTKILSKEYYMAILEEEGMKKRKKFIYFYQMRGIKYYNGTDIFYFLT